MRFRKFSKLPKITQLRIGRAVTRTGDSLTRKGIHSQDCSWPFVWRSWKCWDKHVICTGSTNEMVEREGFKREHNPLESNCRDILREHEASLHFFAS